MVAQVQSILVRGENEGRDDVQQWLAEADEILVKANGILEESNSVADNKRLCSSCWDPTSCWETGDILRGIDRILQEREGFDLSSLIFGPAYCKNLHSRENMLEEILEALMDIHVNMIGIYGMFGVGKSMLAEELARRAQSNQLFDATVMVKLSESVDVKLIQTQITTEIGLQLSDDDDEETRAHILYNELDKKVMESGQGNNIETIQQSKILMILDGVNCVIDLSKVGISQGRERKSRCKILLISRNADVCKEMGGKKNFLVDCLDSKEAKILFLEILGDNMEGTDDMLERENGMLVKCGGLPLMINSLACSLRSMSLSNWEILADKMRRHTLLEVDEVKEVACAILELCNKFIQIGGKQKLFLLCCLLIQKGDDVSLEKIMRYGIGFGLFEVGSSDSIVKQINSWVHELKSLSLLVESEKPQHVKMHDLIQDVVISALSQGDYNLPVMMGAGTGWHTRESYENCVALSMMPHSNFKCLNGLELPKLEAFMVKAGELSLSLPNNFFQGMQNLKILDISGRSSFEYLKLLDISWRSSIGDLKNLVTLHLEYCKLGGMDTSMICNLPRLQVLSLRGSRFGTTLPDEIGNLTNLRVLDLTSCRFLGPFPIDAVAKLDQLRELYLCHTDRKWSTGDLKQMAALPLEVFEIVISATSHDQLSPGAFKFPNLRSFRVLYSSFHQPFFDEHLNSYSSNLSIQSCERIELSKFEQSGLQDLLQRTEYLKIKEVSGLGKGIGELNVMHGGGFSQLKRLFVNHCQGMECILDASNQSSIIDQQAVEIFPELQVLTLSQLSNLTSLVICCPQPCYYSFFPKLRELTLDHLRQLGPYVLPVQLAVTLRVMEVSRCQSLLYIFTGASEILNESGHGADISTVELSYMEKLELNGLASLVGLEDSSKASIVGEEFQILFDDKMDFSSLENLQVSRMDIEFFQGHGETTRFPNLSRLTLTELPNLKALPSINSKTLRLLDFDNIECFKGLSSKQLPTYQHYMPFIMSCELIEELKLSSFDSLKEVIDEEKSVDNRGEFDVKPLFSLRKLKLSNLPELRRIPWCMLTNLRSLVIYGLDGLTCLISTSLLVGGHVMLPLLETIHISSCNNLEAIISREREEDDYLVEYGITLFPSLRHIHLSFLYQLENFSKGSYEAHFPSLETVEIKDCGSLQSFSSGFTRTPRLNRVKVGLETFDDLNNVVTAAKRRETIEAKMRGEAKRREEEEAEWREEAKRWEEAEAKITREDLSKETEPALSTNKLASTEKAEAWEASKSKGLYFTEEEEESWEGHKPLLKLGAQATSKIIQEFGDPFEDVKKVPTTAQVEELGGPQAAK